uniref:C2H2-type domain-containing protein n=1 Tax=Vespula pensylvanica TaxID=30213 RepID=A0A834NRP3_VESPE|nr:hypothetical protein H0235_011075 [Vespula pensylvanica]
MRNVLKSQSEMNIIRLECFLPPPPPPPPPIISSTNAVSTTSGIQNQQQREQQKPTVETTITTTTLTTVTTETITSSTAANPNTIQTALPNLAVPTPYILHPTMQPQTPTQQPIPWWISTEADTSADMYAQWYDTSYKAGPAVNTVVQVSAVQPSSKPKNKYYKRKNEFIDPAQDAEKVASAQRELSALMKPLKCDLCNAVMNSTLQAKLHYDGKPHQKKVSMFLNQSVKKQKSEDGQVSSTTDWQNRCDICKTWFSSQIEASQHYAGKKHIRAAHGGPRSRPKKSQNQNQYNHVDSTGRYGIGMAFQQDVQVPGTSAVVSDGNIMVSPQGTTTPIYTPPAYPTPLRCDLCGVSANRQDQLETHKRGARHMRMLRLNGLPIPELLSENENASSSSGPIDYSIYRTPSGQYYCAPCNLSLNSESTFAQHVESKKHKNQSNPKSPLNAAVISKKARFKKK